MKKISCFVRIILSGIQSAFVEFSKGKSISIDLIIFDFFFSHFIFAYKIECLFRPEMEFHNSLVKCENVLQSILLVFGSLWYVVCEICFATSNNNEHFVHFLSKIMSASNMNGNYVFNRIISRTACILANGIIS